MVTPTGLEPVTFGLENRGCIYSALPNTPFTH
jgi:hypothetical protein